MKDYAHQQRAPRKHWVGWAGVVLLHGLILWAINSGLTRQPVKRVSVPVQAQLIEEVKPVLPPPPLLPPPSPSKNVPPPPTPAYVPPVDVPVTSAPPSNVVISTVSSPPPTPPSPPAPAPLLPPQLPSMVRVAPVINAAVNCERPQYPSASRRAEEEGVVQLKFMIGVDGLVVRAEIEKSSGYARLDEAARTAMSRCQFKPGTVDGKPEPSWASMRYVWRLE